MDPNTTISGPPSVRQRNASGMMEADDGRPNIECWLSSFVIFQGIRTSLAKKTYIFVIFQKGALTTCPPSGSAHADRLNSPNATPRENLTLFRAKNEDADQPVHPISACIVR